MGIRSLQTSQVFPRGTGTFAPLRARQETRIIRIPMNLSDAIYLLFLLVCCWLALNCDSDGGGGKRARLPAAC